MMQAEPHPLVTPLQRAPGPADEPRHGRPGLPGRDGGRGSRARTEATLMAEVARAARDPASASAGGGPRTRDEEDDGDEAAAHAGRLRVRTVFISDTHLGTPGCQARALLEFLRDVECETLYLVGDIIDGWQLKRSWYWPQAHNDVLQKLLRKARKGTRVIFVPGNHDEFARRYVAHTFGGVEVMDEAIHLTADGRRLWVTHGDHFDGVIQCAKWLAYLGDMAYEAVLKINHRFNSIRARMGLPYWSLSRYLKGKVKRAVNYISDFEGAVAAEARKRGADGVVCGHIHHAEIRDIDGVLYCNDGDWVESLTALVEHADGRLEIIDRSARMSLSPGATAEAGRVPVPEAAAATRTAPAETTASA
jgi:UDP-2,3-diacylglucosamine pyrophosphatase LpxH